MVAQHTNAVVEAAKVGVSVVGTTYTMFGLPFADVAALVTLIYTCFMGYLAFRDRVYRPWRNKVPAQAS